MFMPPLSKTSSIRITTIIFNANFNNADLSWHVHCVWLTGYEGVPLFNFFVMFLRRSDTNSLPPPPSTRNRFFLDITIYYIFKIVRKVNLFMFVTLVMCTFADSRRACTVIKKCRPPLKISLISDHIFLLFHLPISSKMKLKLFIFVWPWDMYILYAN